jgi:hypothetical protein
MIAVASAAVGFATAPRTRVISIIGLGPHAVPVMGRRTTGDIIVCATVIGVGVFLVALAVIAIGRVARGGVAR